MNKINLVTVCTDQYPMVYANKLHRQFSRLTNLNVEHYCITDRSAELSNGINPITPFLKSKGWWNKVNVFHRNMPKGTILYMDLDIVILKNFDHEILEMAGRTESISCVSDAIGWMGEKFSSSLMCFQSGVHHKIYERFSRVEAKINETEGGDQVWTGPQLDSIYYIDKDFPNLKKNLKFHLAIKISDSELRIPQGICDKVKLVDCGGEPKPHDLGSIPYVKTNWHDV